jgi:acyl carrier protein
MENQFLLNVKEALEISDRDLSLTDNFRDYEEWDSLKQLSLIAMLDEQYGVEIEYKDFRELKTLGDLLSEVKKRG